MRGARHFKELIIWQIGDGLRIELLKIMRRSPMPVDLKFRSQLEDLDQKRLRDPHRN